LEPAAVRVTEVNATVGIDFDWVQIGAGVAVSEVPIVTVAPVLRFVNDTISGATSFVGSVEISHHRWWRRFVTKI